MIRLIDEGGIQEESSVEARAEYGEFVVWYGHYFGGDIHIGDLSNLRSNPFNRAVHVYFPELLPERLSAKIRDAASFGLILERMLADPEKYPPNYFSPT